MEATLPILLRQLKLARFRSHWQSLAAQAEAQGWSHPQFLYALCELESDQRQIARRERLLREAHLPWQKSLTDYDHHALAPEKWQELQALSLSPDWLLRGENLLIFGPSGVGKTHLAGGITMALIAMAQPCRFFAATALVQLLQKAKAVYELPAMLQKLDRYGASDKLAAVIQAAGLSGPDLGAYCRERGLYPKQLARWRQATEDANGPSAPTMTEHRDLQRKNQEQARQIRRLERELQKKEKALSEAATLLMLSKKLDQLWLREEES